jgi:hypothetical protein
MKKLPFHLLVCLLSACSKTVLIVPVDEQGSTLSKAEVILDDSQTFQGATHVEIPSNGTHQLIVRYPPLYAPEEITLNHDSDAEIRVTLHKDPSLRDTIAADDLDVIPNQWMVVAISDSYALRGEWWRVLIAGIVSADFQPSLLDERSGYLATQWKERRYAASASGAEHVVRHRIRGNIVSAAPLLYRVRVEVERKRNSEKEFSPWNRIFPEDLSVIRQFKGLMERPELVM